jgi:hypothetical protein
MLLLRQLSGFESIHPLKFLDGFIRNVADPGCLFRVQTFLSRNPGQNGTGSRIRNNPRRMQVFLKYKFFPHALGNMIEDVYPRSRAVKKAMDRYQNPGSATLLIYNL